MRKLAALLMLLGATLPAGAASSYDQAFVDAFAEACVPGRLSFEATRDTARAAGWVEVERDDHPELAVTMAKADEIIAADPDFEMDIETLIHAREVAGTRHHLSVSRTIFVVQEGEPPWVMVGCHLHNFDATAPIDPAPLTALLEKPISHSVDQDGLIGHVWGPPCPMPRTGDTYLSFVAEGSPASETTGFSGLSLNFSTSTPDEGEEVPETYC
jgi:hypothetical protein